MPAERSTKPFKPQRPSTQLPTQSTQSQSQNSPPPQDEDEDEKIPPALLTSLIHEFFTDPNTRISKSADKAMGKYIDIFVREAIMRAAHERALAQKEGGNMGGGAGEGFLEVEDLERLAPQLVLDF